MNHIPTTPSSPPASPVSDLGVPLSIKRSRKVSTTDDKWDLIHHLEKPYMKRNSWKSSKTVYHNICVLCCDNIKARSKTNRYSWEGALPTTKNTTNTKDHIEAEDVDNPLAVLNVLISKWMITQSLPYTVASSNSFQDVICAATGNPTYPILSRDRHDRLLNGQFQLFCDLVGELITSDFEIVCKLKFLDLIHDIWTTCDKDSIVGVSDTMPLLYQKLSKKNVADRIGTEQENSAEHLPNLCIGYGLGLKDNIQTVTVWSESKNAWENVVRTVTSGGALDEGVMLFKNLATSTTTSNRLNSDMHCQIYKSIILSRSLSFD
ncbi:hypothetical protein PHPALM_36260 [Phytophthora palmivora]|uniref:Uncharacterized protein n=1 Tax=Phytophthora palmivora TaxID=4796 RepID=A0A2P4X0E9_9STRA|nr:hypothetical protein PHPALM_36260 [Phytophthora palmivora]